MNLIKSLQLKKISSWKKIENDFEFINIHTKSEHAQVRVGILRACADLYTYWKNRLHKHFRDNGGPEDMERARVVVHQDCNQSTWNDRCNYFISEDFLKNWKGINKIVNKRNTTVTMKRRVDRHSSTKRVIQLQGNSVTPRQL